MIKHLSIRRLSQPIARAKSVDKQTESAKRKLAGTSHRMADRRRGWKRGGAR